MIASEFVSFFIIFQGVVKIWSGKISFLSHPDIQLATNHTGPYLLSVKRKGKKWGHWL